MSIIPFLVIGLKKSEFFYQKSDWKKYSFIKKEKKAIKNWRFIPFAVEIAASRPGKWNPRVAFCAHQPERRESSIQKKTASSFSASSRKIIPQVQSPIFIVKGCYYITYKSENNRAPFLYLCRQSYTILRHIRTTKSISLAELWLDSNELNASM